MRTATPMLAALQGHPEILAAVLQQDNAERRGQQRHLHQERDVDNILRRLHRKKPQAGEDCRDRACCGHAQQEGSDDGEGGVPKKSQKAQIERQDAAEQEAYAKNMRGIDEQISGA